MNKNKEAKVKKEVVSELGELLGAIVKCNFRYQCSDIYAHRLRIWCNIHRVNSPGLSHKKYHSLLVGFLPFTFDKVFFTFLFYFY